MTSRCQCRACAENLNPAFKGDLKCIRGESDPEIVWLYDNFKRLRLHKDENRTKLLTLPLIYSDLADCYDIAQGELMAKERQNQSNQALVNRLLGAS